MNGPEFESTTPIQPEKKPDKKIIIEIGTGAKPFPIVGKRKIKADEHYIGIEENKRETKAARDTLVIWEMLRGKKSSGKMDVLTTRAQNLPFQDNSVDEVVLSNLFCLLHHFKAEHAHRDQDLILAEINRVLKDGGKLTIIENSTPTPAKEGLSEIEDAGFREILAPTEKPEARADYYEPGDKDPEDSFIAQYEKIGELGEK
ncbi:MAG: methyltransferase domain-containing protein [Candidatus Berkelbacteria bacterium]|nr:methyltransferase domain-containing protein [Candidatus Berkelbacteria bacterium]